MHKYNLKLGLNAEILYREAQKIKERRQKLFIKQKQFSLCLGIHPSNYCKFEQGKLNISLLQYLHILELLEHFEEFQQKVKEDLLCLEKKKIENWSISETAEEVTDCNGLH